MPDAPSQQLDTAAALTAKAMYDQASGANQTRRSLGTEPTMTSNYGIYSHGLIQTARGLCTDEAPHTEIDAMLARAVEQIKDVGGERDHLRATLRRAIAYLGTDGHRHDDPADIYREGCEALGDIRG